LAGSRLESLEDAMDAAADKFVAELDRAIEIAGRDTPTLASRRPWHSEVRPAAIPVCYFPSGETGSRPRAGHRSRAPATRVLEGSALAVSRFSRWRKNATIQAADSSVSEITAEVPAC